MPVFCAAVFVLLPSALCCLWLIVIRFFFFVVVGRRRSVISPSLIHCLALTPFSTPKQSILLKLLLSSFLLSLLSTQLSTAGVRKCEI